jgi:hypothetical protein
MATTTNEDSSCNLCNEKVPSEHHLCCRIGGTVKEEFEDLERGLPEYDKGEDVLIFIYNVIVC